jgi:phosphatidylserine/phosphatidylglycerophosphate/cardiolipin synthase-like enzyme
LLRGIRVPGGRPISDDEALVAFNALCDLGVLEKNGPRYVLNKARFEATEQLRCGIQAATASVDEYASGTVPEAQLCVSLPPNLPAAAAHVIHECSTDLRSGLLDVAASATQSLIVASPFWDAGTTAEMVALARKKLASGVQVSLLGRFSQELPANVKSELSKIASDAGCTILSWYEGKGTDTQTFHFKAISADRGRKAYMGSANMTTSSLRSRMELGVILTGTAAINLDRILRVVITMASPITL